MSRADTRRRKAGATLIEIMVAASLLAVIVVGSAALLHYSRAILRQDRDVRTATDLAAGRLETLRATPPAALTPSVSVRTESRDGRTFTISTALRRLPVPAGAPPGDIAYFEARVTVSNAETEEILADLTSRIAPP